MYTVVYQELTRLTSFSADIFLHLFALWIAPFCIKIVALCWIGQGRSTALQHKLSGDSAIAILMLGFLDATKYQVSKAQDNCVLRKSSQGMRGAYS